MLHDMKKAAAISPRAGKPAPTSMLVDLGRLEREYYERKPESDDPTQVVSFGRAGIGAHRLAARSPRPTS